MYIVFNTFRGDILGAKLSNLEVGSPLSLRISANGKNMRLDALLESHISENSIIISLQVDTEKKLNFGNVKTDMEYYPDGNVPVIWYDVQIMSYDSNYLLQVFGDGARHNRRNNFRVGVSTSAKLNTIFPNCPRQVTIRDVSLSGFSISDRKRELPFTIGNTISVSWEDLGHELNLTGRLIRIEDRVDVTIFGFEICNICKDLSSYINMKQRKNKG